LTIYLYTLIVTIRVSQLTIATGARNIIALMIEKILIFIFGNLLTSFVPSLYMLTLDRIIAAMSQGTFMSVYAVNSNRYCQNI